MKRNLRNGNSNHRYIKPADAHDRVSDIPMLANPIQALSEAEWTEIIPVGQWSNYRLAIDAVRNAGIPFLLGGGIGLAVYTGRWRNTKDIDFYILPRDREATIAALSSIGFTDYFDQRPYDPGWIYRSTKDSIIVDIIWSMANRRAEVDEDWFRHAKKIGLREETLELAPAEELLWCKLYIMQRDHCDWTDILNLLYATGNKLDWNRLIARAGEDLPLLEAVLGVYAWMCPGRAAQLPAKARRLARIPSGKSEGKEFREERVKFLDSRGWFAPMQPRDKVLEV